MNLRCRIESGMTIEEKSRNKYFTINCQVNSYILRAPDQELFELAISVASSNSIKQDIEAFLKKYSYYIDETDQSVKS